MLHFLRVCRGHSVCCHNLGSRGFVTYVPTEKIMVNTFNKEYESNDRKWKRDIEINTMKTGMQLIASRGFRLEDKAGLSEMKLIRENDKHLLEEHGISSVTIDFDCWAQALKDGSPEAYDVIVRKSMDTTGSSSTAGVATTNPHYLVITCVNAPNMLPVGVRIIPNEEPMDNLKLYNGPRLTRLPGPLLSGISQYLQTVGVDEQMGAFIHSYIDYKVRKEMHAALHSTINSALALEPIAV